MRPSAEVRRASKEDFERVHPLLMRLTDRLTADDWRRLFTNYWQCSNFRPGLILEAGGDVVGFIATIYRERVLGDRRVKTCNLSSWIVRDDYRSASIMLLLSLIRDKGVTYTSFSSNDITYEVYRRFKFVDDETYAHVFYPVPSPRSDDYRIVTDERTIAAALDPTQVQLLRDHVGFKCRNVLVSRRDGESCWLVVGVREGRMKVYYASEPGFLRRYVGHFRRKLLRRFKARKLYIGGNIIGDNKPFLTRRKDYAHPHQVRPCGNDRVDRLYSELLLLDM